MTRITKVEKTLYVIKNGDFNSFIFIYLHKK